MTETQLDVQKRKEETQRYDNINRRIAAVDRDIATETDGERIAALREKRDGLAADREGAAAELTALDRRGNGDLEILQRKVSELGQALVSDNPQEAHAIINECAAALARMDHRVMGLEGRVTAISDRPGPLVDVTLSVGTATIVSRLSRRSSVRLGLAPGMKAYALVKAVALDRHAVGFA